MRLLIIFLIGLSPLAWQTTHLVFAALTSGKQAAAPEESVDLTQIQTLIHETKQAKEAADDRTKVLDQIEKFEILSYSNVPVDTRSWRNGGPFQNLAPIAQKIISIQQTIHDLHNRTGNRTFNKLDMKDLEKIEKLLRDAERPELAVVADNIQKMLDRQKHESQLEETIRLAKKSLEKLIPKHQYDPKYKTLLEQLEKLDDPGLHEPEIAELRRQIEFWIYWLPKKANLATAPEKQTQLIIAQEWGKELQQMIKPSGLREPPRPSPDHPEEERWKIHVEDFASRLATQERFLQFLENPPGNTNDYFQQLTEFISTSERRRLLRERFPKWVQSKLTPKSSMIRNRNNLVQELQLKNGVWLNGVFEPRTGSWRTKIWNPQTGTFGLAKKAGYELIYESQTAIPPRRPIPWSLVETYDKALTRLLDHLREESAWKRFRDTCVDCQQQLANYPEEQLKLFAPDLSFSSEVEFVTDIDRNHLGVITALYSSP